MNTSLSFGQIVRERRGALGLTQAELARRAGCAPVTVRKIEADALRPSVQLAELLALALDVPEAEQLAFVRLARDEKPLSPLPKPTPSPGEIGMADLSGRAVKGFELAERIGSGGFGVVYRAVQPSVNRDVAVKIILPRFANHPTFIRRFEAEAHLVARLEHPHIVPLYDYWRQPGAAYLIMRLLRGGSLVDRLADGPLSLVDAWRVIQQVGQALAAAHARSVVHQDIKPANVLLDEIGNGYLADFGIAKNLTFAEGGNLAETGNLISSPAYIAPEQIRDEPLRPSADIYSFGLLLFEMFTGHAAFQEPTLVSLLQQHLNAPLPRLRDTAPGLPVALDDVLQRATAKDPTLRFAEMGTLLAAIERILLPVISEGGTLDVGETAVPALSTQEIAALENPYRGLRAFTESDVDNFFGRETLVQELLGLLSDGSDLERFVAVVGPSGSGKSSVVKAGLLPALRRGGLPGSDSWFIVDLTPGSHPWEEVESALLRVAVNPPELLLAQLQEDNRGLLRAVHRCLPDDGETELLLLIDQFEELFTLVENEAVRAHFLRSLVTAVLDPRSRLRIMVTMRADFMDRPLQYVDFGELMQQRMSMVLPLTADELTQAITQPVEKLGMTMTPELVATIIQDVGEQPGMLPLLQYALTELFAQRSGRTLTLDTYRETGGVTGALARRADDIYNKLDRADQEAARQLFLRLITLGEGVEDTRRRVLLTEIASLSVSREPYAVNRGPNTEHETRNTDYGTPVTEYGKHRLLTFDHDPVTRRPTVEVAHEALLREWPRLRGWLRDSREDVRRQRLLAQAAALWQANGQDDSYLLRGSRLTDFEAWAETTTMALTTVERDYLQTSVTARDARRAAEEARRQRELETAQQLAQEQTLRAEEQAEAAQSLRQRALWLTGALALVAMLAVIAVALARAANENANLAQVNEREAVESYSLSLAANARQALAADDQPLALLLALAANSVDNPPRVAYQTLVDIAYAPGVNRQYQHDSPINATALSSDSRFLLTGSDDGLLLLWEIATGEVVRTFDGHQAGVTAVAFSADGRQALSGSADDTAVLWDVTSGAELMRLVGHKGDVSGVAFTPDGQFAVTGEDTIAAPSDLIVWDLVTGEPVRQFGATEDGNPEGILDMALTSDGRYALVGQFSYAAKNDRQTLLWNVNSGEVVHVLAAIKRTVSAVAISPDGRYGLAGGDDAFVYQWDLETGELARRLGGHEGAVQAVAFNADGSQALSASLDQTLIWWDLETGEVIRRFATDQGEIHAVNFLGEGQAITAAKDGVWQIWDLTSAWQLARWGDDGTGHLPTEPNANSFGMGLAISPDGRFAISGGNEPDTTVILWEYETGAVRQKLSVDEGNIFDVAFYPDSKKALIGTQFGLILEWDLSNDVITRQLEGHHGSIHGLAISSDGRYAVSASLDNTIGYWDLQSGEMLQRMVGHFEGRGAFDVLFLPGEQYAVSSGWDGTLIIWDLPQGAQVRRLTGLTGGAGNHFTADGDWGIHRLSLSPDGRRLLSAGRDESLLMWDLASGDSLRRFVGHAGAVIDVEMSPDGQTALTSARNDALIVWDVATGTPIRRLPINNRLNSSFWPTVAVHPDGRSALSTEADGAILKWQWAEPAVPELASWLADNRTLRELSCTERETYGIEPLCVDGVAQATTAELLAAVAEAEPVAAAAAVETIEPPAAPFGAEMLARFVGTAVKGENRGELTRHHFDVWTYEGKAGEVLQFQVLADQPLTDVTIPLAARYDAGVLDTLLFVVAPDGSLIAFVNDDDRADGTFSSNANIEAVQLPEDGIYRIEVRSFLDETAGAYTLKIEPRTYEVDAAELEEYVGYFLDGPWEYDVYQYVENGRLYQDVAQYTLFELIPIGPSEFIISDGSRLVFRRDETGNVTGYRIWIPTIHPVGGQWYEGIKIGD